jgi:hypothetical protein
MRPSGGTLALVHEAFRCYLVESPLEEGKKKSYVLAQFSTNKLSRNAPDIIFVLCKCVSCSGER